MSVKHNDCKIEISIEQLLEETNSAAQRVRWTTIVLILATGIIGIGFYNSTEWSFTNERLKALSSFENTPVNNFADASNKPLLDSYFGENDFNETHFPVGFVEVYQDKTFKGLKKFVCFDIYNSVSPELTDKSKVPHPALGKYLYDSFSSKTKELVKEDCKNYLISDENSIFENDVNFGFLTNDLNRILSDIYLYNKERFDFLFTDEKSNKIQNIEELRNIFESWVVKNAEESNTDTNSSTNKSELEALRKKVDVVRLNRLLLEAAFSEEILPSKDIIPSGQSLLVTQLSKEMAFDDKVQFIQLPFFGNAIDVNDLGIVGGISLIVILLLLRFSLSREIKNLNLSFKQAFYQGKLDYFYHLLAMKQVLTIPEMAGEAKNQSLTASSKLLNLLPVIVISLGVGYDFYSIFHYGVYDWKFVLTHLIAEITCVIIIIILSGRCLERQMHVDEIWEDYNDILFYYRENNNPTISTKASEENTKLTHLTSECCRKITEDSNELINSEFCKKIAENPNELLDKAFKQRTENDIDKLETSQEQKQIVEIVRKRFSTNPPPDEYLIISLFLPANLAKLIPSKRIAERIAKLDFTVYLKVLIVSLSILLISLAVQFLGAKLFSRSMIAEDIKDVFIIIGAIGGFLGGVGTLISGYVKLDEKWKKTTKEKSHTDSNELQENDGNRIADSKSKKDNLSLSKAKDIENPRRRPKSPPKNRKPKKENDNTDKEETKND